MGLEAQASERGQVLPCCWELHEKPELKPLAVLLWEDVTTGLTKQKEGCSCFSLASFLLVAFSDSAVL